MVSSHHPHSTSQATVSGVTFSSENQFSAALKDAAISNASHDQKQQTLLVRLLIYNTSTAGLSKHCLTRRCYVQEGKRSGRRALGDISNSTSNCQSDKVSVLTSIIDLR